MLARQLARTLPTNYLPLADSTLPATVAQPFRINLLLLASLLIAAAVGTLTFSPSRARRIYATGTSSTVKRYSITSAANALFARAVIRNPFAFSSN